MIGPMRRRRYGTLILYCSNTRPRVRPPAPVFAEHNGWSIGPPTPLYPVGWWFGQGRRCLRRAHWHVLT